MNSKAALPCSLSHSGFPGNLITSQICSPTRMTNLLKQVSPWILLLASPYNSWTHPGSCQLPQELSQVPVTVTGSQLLISTLTATGQDPTVLIPDEVTITLGYQSLLCTEFHTDTTLSPIRGAMETVPQLGGNSPRNRKEQSPFPYLHRLELHPCDPWGVYHWLGASQRVQNILPLRWQAHKFALLWVKWGVDTVLKVLRGRDLWAFLLLLAEHDAWIEEGNTVSACLGLKCPSSKITYQFYELIMLYWEHSPAKSTVTGTDHLLLQMRKQTPRVMTCPRPPRRFMAEMGFLVTSFISTNSYYLIKRFKQ